MLLVCGCCICLLILYVVIIRYHDASHNDNDVGRKKDGMDRSHDVMFVSPRAKERSEKPNMAAVIVLVPVRSEPAVSPVVLLPGFKEQVGGQGLMRGQPDQRQFVQDNAAPRLDSSVQTSSPRISIMSVDKLTKVKKPSAFITR